MTSRDVAIAGCGPGGLAAALFLHRAGHAVTLYERFDQPQPVGSGLRIQPTGLAVLDALGLAAPLRQLSAPIRGLNGVSMPSGRRALTMTYAAIDPEMTAYGVHRSLLFDLLFDAVRAAGIGVETGRAVSGAEPASASRVLPLLRDLLMEPMDRIPLVRRLAARIVAGQIWLAADGD